MNLADGNYTVKDGIIYSIKLPIGMKPSKSINIMTGEIHYTTNADRIRSMTDEELAHWLEDHLCHAFCPDFNVDIDPVTKECLWHDGNCWMCILDWLKQEVTDEL